jgi:Bacterial membrane protein YfhO
MPLMVLTALRFRDDAPEGGRWLATPVFAVAFVANFYTAYMAAIGAGMIVVALMLTQPDRWHRSARALGSWVLRAALGTAMAAVLIVPTYFAVQQAAQPPPPSFQPGTALDWIAAMLPGADTVTRAPTWSPAIPVVALMVVGLSRGPIRPRVVWASLLGLTLVSMALAPTALLWHGGDVPDGNAFRQAWVAAGVLTVGAWQLAPSAAKLARRRSGWTLPLLAAILLAGVLVIAFASTIVVPLSVALGVLLALATGVVVAARGVDRPWGGATLLAMVALVLLVGQPSAVGRFSDRVNVLVEFDWLSGLSAHIERALDAGHGISAGLDVTRRRTTNDPLLLGGSGLSGYSTMMPASSARIGAVAGATVRASGRRILTRGSSLEHAVFGLNDRQARDRHQARWLEPSAAPRALAPTSAFAFYAAHLMGQVRRPGLDGASTAAGWTGTVTCPAPTTVLYADGAHGALALELDGRSRGLPPRAAWAGTLTEVASGGGPWPVVLQGGDPADVLFCAASQPVPPGIPATITRDGHSFRVRAAPPGPATELLVATPYTAEWTCRRSDGDPAGTYESGGLLGIDAAGLAVNCSFGPRGLGLGVGVSGAAAAGAIGWQGAVFYRRRRGSSRSAST